MPVFGVPTCRRTRLLTTTALLSPSSEAQRLAPGLRRPRVPERRRDRRAAGCPGRRGQGIQHPAAHRASGSRGRAPARRARAAAPAPGPGTLGEPRHQRLAQQRPASRGYGEQAEHLPDPAGQVGGVGGERRPRVERAAGPEQPRHLGRVERDPDPVRADAVAPVLGGAHQVDARRQGGVAPEQRVQPLAPRGAPTARLRAVQASASMVPRSVPTTTTVAPRPPGGRPRRTRSARIASTSTGSPTSR